GKRVGLEIKSELAITENQGRTHGLCLRSEYSFQMTKMNLPLLMFEISASRKLTMFRSYIHQIVAGCRFYLWQDVQSPKYSLSGVTPFARTGR
ncbi:MAG: hypothetical protein ACLQBD_04540, partial [Syntrophobacteraceae bacterium]